jgi:DHA2 family multidrug resistance protein
MLLVALYTQKLLGYDAWNSGAVLGPGGVGNLISLIIAGRLVTRVDQRILVTLGCAINAVSLYMMSQLTLTVDYWSLVWPRFLQGLGLGFIFVPLVTLTLATIDRQKLGNATAAFNVLRNLGGSVGVALTTTFLTRRSQGHQSVLAAHVNVWDPETAARLKAWTTHFARAVPTRSPRRSRRPPCSIGTWWDRRRCWPTPTTSGCSPSSSPCCRSPSAHAPRPLPARCPASDQPSGRVEPLPSAVE